jgi:hypothetical protein
MLAWMMRGELILSSAPLIGREEREERNKLRRQGKRYGLGHRGCVFFPKELLEK